MMRLQGVVVFMGIASVIAQVPFLSTTLPPQVPATTVAPLITTPLVGTVNPLATTLSLGANIPPPIVPTTSTTFTAWDMGNSLSLSSGGWESSGSFGLSSMSSSGLPDGSSGDSSASLNSDMSNSGNANSLGSQTSGSSGSFLRIWHWVLLALLGLCCCALAIGGAIFAYFTMQKKKPKRRPQRQYDDRDFSPAPPPVETQPILEPTPPPMPEPMPMVEPVTTYEQPLPSVYEYAAPAMTAPMAPSYYTQYPGGSMMQPMMQPQTGSMMQPMMQPQTISPYPGTVV